ncbi:MAG: oxidoreductase [Cyclobacteriaceae bacterium]
MKVWFITGCSTGLGLELAKVAVAKGDKVVGTLRQEGQIAAFEQIGPGQAKGVLLDVTNQDQVAAGVQQAIDAFGQIDVLVNNAGYGLMGSVEEISDAEAKQQFEVNVFGVLNVIRKVLPIMRKQRSGHILNITSIAGLQGYPGVGIYNGSKFALEGIGEALAKEVAHLGIKVTNVEPGPFRTDWGGRSATYVKSDIEDYADSAAKNMEAISGVSGKQIGDPAKAGEAMYRLTQLDKAPMHLLLGGPANQRAKMKLAEFLKEIDEYEHIGLSTDYTEEELIAMGEGAGVGDPMKK